MGWSMSIDGVATVLDTFDTLRTQWDGDTLYVVAPTVSYALFQERGTADIEARPYMQPAAERVEANPRAMLRKHTGGVPDSEEAIIEGLAVAVRNEAKRIADEKDIRDTGALINSITYERVR